MQQPIIADTTNKLAHDLYELFLKITDNEDHLDMAPLYKFYEYQLANPDYVVKQANNLFFTRLFDQLQLYCNSPERDPNNFSDILLMVLGDFASKNLDKHPNRKTMKNYFNIIIARESRWKVHALYSLAVIGEKDAPALIMQDSKNGIPNAAKKRYKEVIGLYMAAYSYTRNPVQLLELRDICLNKMRSIIYGQKYDRDEIIDIIKEFQWSDCFIYGILGLRIDFYQHSPSFIARIGNFFDRIDKVNPLISGDTLSSAIDPDASKPKQGNR